VYSAGVDTEALPAVVYGRQSRNKAKSITEQIDAGVSVAADEGWNLVGRYSDGSSASRYARRGRDDWPRVLADIEAGNITVLILWESSRGDRTLTSWSALLDLCRERGVGLYIISDERLYDPRHPKDWKTLATDGVNSAAESDLISLRVRRGHSGAAKEGRPSHGRTPIGYRRVYDPSSGELVGQEPDDVHGPTVREIIERIAGGEPVCTVQADLNERGVPTVGAERWYHQRILAIVRNPAYAGFRMYNGTRYKAAWPALVDEEIWKAAQRVLEKPGRVTTRPGSQKYLLSFLATCGACGSKMYVRARNEQYSCSVKGCVTMRRDDVDRFVTGMTLARLSNPDLYRALRQAGEAEDQEAVKARDEAAELRRRLDDWRRSGAAGKTTPESLAVIEEDLSAQIEAADLRADRAAVPQELRQILRPGADVRERWADAVMPVRRAALRYLAEVRMDRAIKAGRQPFNPWRLAGSRWVGAAETWGDAWAREGLPTP
jgi:site-specific DNA recombinase